MPGIFPRGDNEFLAAIEAFHDYLVANESSLSAFDSSRVTSLDAVKKAYKDALDNKLTKENESQSATAEKNAQREIAEEAFNEAAKDFKDDDNVGDAELEAAGFNAKDETPTAVGAPETRPVATIDTRQRLEHRINFIDETAATSASRAKPEGVRACQLWVKIGGTPPTEIKECAFLAEDSASPYLAVYSGADAGKTAYYVLRWVSTRGETGPISETVAATITG